MDSGKYVPDILLLIHSILLCRLDAIQSQTEAHQYSLLDKSDMQCIRGVVGTQRTISLHKYINFVNNTLLRHIGWRNTKDAWQWGIKQLT